MSVPRNGRSAPSRCTTATPPTGGGGGEDWELGLNADEPASIPTDALFAENVERKVSNPLAHFLAARSFLPRLTKLIRGRCGSARRATGSTFSRRRPVDDPIELVDVHSVDPVLQPLVFGVVALDVCASERVEAAWLLQEPSRRIFNFASHQAAASRQWRNLHRPQIDFATEAKVIISYARCRGLPALSTNSVSFVADTPALPERSHSGSASRPSAGSSRRGRRSPG
jgi:hypothetical protein